MRDAFGGTFMLQFTLVFIVIYVSFMATAIVYAKTFRVKDHVIDIVEQYQYRLGNDRVSNDANDKIEDYLKSVSYYTGNLSEDKYCKGEAYFTGRNTGRRVCIQSKYNSGSTSNSTSDVLVVTAYIPIHFPFFDLDFVIPVRGETKTIYY